MEKWCLFPADNDQTPGIIHYKGRKAYNSQRVSVSIQENERRVDVQIKQTNDVYDPIVHVGEYLMFIITET